MKGIDPLPASGTTFEGRYEILARLGEGGFGTVHKATQIATGQAVALKVLRLPEPVGEARSERRIARFLREMRLCAQLHHPNLVQLVDSGRTDDGLVYTVFSFAPGDNLGDLLAREGALDPAEARHLMLQVLDALACAHSEGVVHRDLKPANIMIVPTGARRNALVLDFGIGAIVQGDEEDGSPRLTATNETLGTPGYAAPEQWRGQEPTPRADLFSWGLVFLECLTGKRVYEGGSAAEIIYRQLGPEPVAVPPALDRHPLGDIVRAVTRKDVAARDVTARGIFAALDACDLRGVSRGMLSRGGESGTGSDDTLAYHFMAPSSAASGERRQVVAVCCKLSVEPTSSEQLSAEAKEDLLRSGLALAAHVARQHMGYSAAILGDEVLVYFGYPRAEEDDAQRAARAALAITSAIAREAEQLAAKGARIDVRMGVHAGLVIAGDAALTAGSTARLASHLSRVAPPGVVLVTADAHKLLRTSFALEAEGKTHIEGTAASKVFRLLGAESATGPTRPTPEGAQTPLVGREQEIELLLDRWRRARAGGGQCGLITGEPGIGKSRLGRELQGCLANEAHTFIEGRCSPDTRNNALYPVIELLGRALGLEQETSPAGKAARLAAQIERHGLTAAEAMPLFLPLFSLPLAERWSPLDVSPQKQKELTHSAILSLLLTMAEERPLLLLLEDLHWADPTTLDLLGQLVREVPSAPMCLLLTARPEFSPAFSTTGMLQLQLNRLDRAQIEALVGELVGKKALPAAVLDQVVNRTDGVPLFVEELTRMMVESGTLVEHEDRYELAGSLSNLEIPSTLRALLTARLDRLGRAKETAQLAAALGREFSVEVLAAVSTLGAEGVQEDLDALMSAGLASRKRRMKDPQAAFKHALVRDAAYESMTSETRKKIHTRIAATLKEKFPAIAEARPELLARHYASAGMADEAVDHWEVAGRRANGSAAFLEAEGHFRQALEAQLTLPGSPQRDQREIDLRSGLGLALISTKGFAAPDVEATYARAAELIGQTDDIPYPVLNGVLSVVLTRPDCAGAERVMPAVRRYADGPEPAWRLAALSSIGTYECYRGDFTASLEVCRRGMEILDTHEPRKLMEKLLSVGSETVLYSHFYGSVSAMPLGLPLSSAAYVRRALALAEEMNHPYLRAQAFAFGAICLAESDHHEAADLGAQGAVLAHKAGLPVWVVSSQMGHAWARARLGELDEAIAMAGPAIAIMRAIGCEVVMPIWLRGMGEILLLKGAFDEGLRIADEGLAAATRSFPGERPPSRPAPAEGQAAAPAWRPRCRSAAHRARARFGGWARSPDVPVARGHRAVDSHWRFERDRPHAARDRASAAPRRGARTRR
jgi:TOMM system kinase/cyclase fusion protein